MSQCYSPRDFEKYFKENMEGLGLVVPNGWFSGYQTAMATGAALSGFVWQYGKATTVAELVGASLLHEKFIIAGAFGLAGYTGAVIGSLVIASGRSLGCGYRLADMINFLAVNKLDFPGWQIFYNARPEVMDKHYKYHRKAFGGMLQARPQDFDYRSTLDIPDGMSLKDSHE